MVFNPCIYGLVDPLEPNHIRYVGKTRHASRFYNHRYEALNCSHLTHKHNWILKLLAAGRSFNMIIIQQCEENISNEYLNDLEVYYIAKYRAEGHDLTNGTDGGDGRDGTSLSDEARKKLSESAKLSWKNLDGSKKIERSKKISEFMKLSWKNPERLKQQRHRQALARSRRAMVTKRNSGLYI